MSNVYEGVAPVSAPVLEFASAEPPTAARVGRRGAREDAIYRRVLALCDLSAAVGAMVLTHLILGHHLVGWDLLAALLVPILAKLLSLYDMDRVTIRRSTLDEAPRLVMLAAVWATSWSLISIPLGGGGGAHPAGHGSGGVGMLWLLLSALMITTHSAVRAAAQWVSGPERLLIVGGSRARSAAAQSLLTDPGARIDVVGYLPLDNERRVNLGPPAAMSDRRRRNRSLDDIPGVIESLRVDRVLILPDASDSDVTLEAVQRITSLNVRVSMLPRLFEVVGSAVAFDSVGGVMVLGLHRPGLSRSSQVIKRGIDLIGAGICATLAAPVFLLAAVAIKLDSRGPVFFHQERIGRDGKAFGMLKFRSMVDGADANREALAHLNETAGLFKVAEDPRITRVGRWLRRTSIDELPQLLNVLRGEMSLVGPRPLVPTEDALVRGRHRARLSLAPGMTGPWQVLGPTRPPLSEMVKTDYLYAITWTVWGDVKLLLRTCSHIWARRGR